MSSRHFETAVGVAEQVCGVRFHMQEVQVEVSDVIVSEPSEEAFDRARGAVTQSIVAEGTIVCYSCGLGSVPIVPKPVATTRTCMLVECVASVSVPSC